MNNLDNYLNNIHNEQLNTLGKFAKHIYKGASNSLHYSSVAAKKLKMKDVQQYLLKHRDLTYRMAQTLKHNPSPENIKIALKRIGQKTAIGLVVGLVIMNAYKKYIRNWSAAGRYCKGTSGSQRTACLRRYKIKILIERVNTLKQSKIYCSKSKDPEKCKRKIDESITKLVDRIEVLQTIEERRKSNIG